MSCRPLCLDSHCPAVIWCFPAIAGCINIYNRNNLAYIYNITGTIILFDPAIYWQDSLVQLSKDPLDPYIFGHLSGKF